MSLKKRKLKNKPIKKDTSRTKAISKLSVRVKKSLNKLPDSPGVYFFKNRRKILYIGKATSLKDRVRSYFAKDIAFVRSLLIENMVEEATAIGFTETDSVLEALILEANLIKKHQPKYNTKEKDDKSFNFVGITKEDFPRIISLRGRELEVKYRHKDFKYIFGPYPAGGSLKEALKIIRKIFPFRDKCSPRIYTDILQNTSIDLENGKGVVGIKGCFNYQIGLCPGVCVGAVSKKEYAKTIKNIKLFFEGKSSKVLENLRIDMEKFAKSHEFERAGRIKKQIFALNHINDIALIKESKLYGGLTSVRGGFRIESYDIAHTGNQNTVGVMTVVQNGEVRKSQYRKFKIHPHTFHNEVTKGNGPKGIIMKGVGVKSGYGGDVGALAQILERRLDHTEWPLPKLIVVDGAKAQKNTVERILDKYGLLIPVVAVVKGAGHKAQRILGKKVLVSSREAEILLANSEAHRFAISYHRLLRDGRTGR